MQSRVFEECAPAEYSSELQCCSSNGLYWLVWPSVVKTCLFLHCTSAVMISHEDLVIHEDLVLDS